MKKPREFKAKMVNGKMVILAQSEIITHPDGRQDVIIHAPCLSVISKANQK